MARIELIHFFLKGSLTCLNDLEPIKIITSSYKLYNRLLLTIKEDHFNTCILFKCVRSFTWIFQEHGYYLHWKYWGLKFILNPMTTFCKFKNKMVFRQLLESLLFTLSQTANGVNIIFFLSNKWRYSVQDKVKICWSKLNLGIFR